MGAKPLFFFLLGWLAVAAVGGYVVAGFEGIKYGAAFGLLFALPMITGAGLRNSLR